MTGNNGNGGLAKNNAVAGNCSVPENGVRGTHKHYRTVESQ
eukprot:CAMPEP_0204148516 /NCGR_PEP_ID=MMETSP0361-20130328/23610_1 /ASSEMBLY_ACC=CAM_ASM_000343 /TAXON_ID=268821 /ORGANISM="Scrippsiella Hangoei, Strain SHTV-5" /LENGTH=40 /DNA_ID= /DNA_START= /DNA_END= /DNA_ORIENTATION=